jgi:hypothetical protein
MCSLPELARVLVVGDEVENVRGFEMMLVSHHIHDNRQRVLLV